MKTIERFLEIQAKHLELAKRSWPNPDLFVPRQKADCFAQTLGDPATVTAPIKAIDNDFDLGDFPHLMQATQDVQQLQTEIDCKGSTYGIGRLVGFVNGFTREPTWFAAAYFENMEPNPQLVDRLNKWKNGIFNN
jgi:hypothetical protein